MAAENKTEKPTAKRIADARKKGQVARSQQLATAAASIAATIMLGRFGGTLLRGLGDRLSSDLAHLGDAPFREVTGGELTSLVLSGGMMIGLLVGPIALTTMMVGVGAQVAQGGFNFTTEPLQFNFAKLNPIAGFKRFGMKQAGLD